MSRQHLDSAFTALHRIQFMQALAFSAQDDMDAKYHITDYADILNDLVKQLQAALDDLERDLAA